MRLRPPPAVALFPVLAQPLAAAPTPGDLWAYVTLGASGIATEELSPIVGGVAVSQGELAFWPVVAAVAVGCWVATALLYALGRWRGRWVRRRWPQIRRPMAGLLRAVRRWPWRSALAVRWAFGARILLPVACGAAHVRLPTYLVGTAISSAFWAAAFVGVGYLFGDAAVAVLAGIRRYNRWAIAVAVVAAAIAWAVLRRRRTAARAAAHVAVPAAATPPLTPPDA